MISGTLLFLEILLPRTKVEAFTDTVAVAAAVSPTWLPWIRDISEVTGYMLPIAGLVWIIVQIVVKILITRKTLRDENRK
jgi:hypothetical protein